jgi:hypothetical protein
LEALQLVESDGFEALEHLAVLGARAFFVGKGFVVGGRGRHWFPSARRAVAEIVGLGFATGEYMPMGGRDKAVLVNRWWQQVKRDAGGRSILTDWNAAMAVEDRALLLAQKALFSGMG